MFMLSVVEALHQWEAWLPVHPCLFLGYSTSQNAYKCFDVEHNRLSLSRHVQFLEDRFPAKEWSTLSSVTDHTSNSNLIVLPRPSPPNPTTVHAPPFSPMQSSLSPSVPSPVVQEGLIDIAFTMIPPHQPVSTPQPDRTYHMVTRSKRGIFKPKLLNASTKFPLPDDVEPTCVSKASSNPHWRDAMSNEFTTLLNYSTWDLVPPPSNANIIGCKWIFRVRRKLDDSVDKYKAHLIIKGFHERSGVEYNETFSPVVKLIIVRVLLSVALMNNWPIR